MNDDTHRQRPSKEAIRSLERFPGLPLERIHQPRSPEALDFARQELMSARFIGLDTETKPVFVKGDARVGPHVVQLATLGHAFIFSVDHRAGHELIRDALHAEHLVKVGFGLKSDRGPLFHRLGVEVRPAVELSAVVRRLGYREPVGLQAAVAIVLRQYLQKSKSVTTSNWARTILSPKQLLYAANDAYAALAVFHALGLADPQSRRDRPLRTSAF